MDAIRNVENEVDKVLRLFSNCREVCDTKIEELITNINETKIKLNSLSSPDQTELSSQQATLIQNTCDTIQKTFSQMTNSHRDLHVPVSKIGKSIDKNFNADFACASDNSLFSNQENRKLLNQAILQYLLRHQMQDVARNLIKEADISIQQKDLDKYDHMANILAALRERDIRPALNWAIKNRQRLKEMNSPLEFKLHHINIIELYKQGTQKQFEIIQYARDNLQPLDLVYSLEIQHLMGGMIYLKDGIENSPYKSFLDPINYKEIEEIFVTDACTVLDLGMSDPVAVAFEAGSIALPALLNINQILSNQGVQNVWRLRDELPVEIDLGRKLQFHSTFSCPILKQQSTDNNPPMRLVCGHVISRDALSKLSSSNSMNKIKCPYCPMEQVVSDATQIHF